MILKFVPRHGVALHHFVLLVEDVVDFGADAHADMPHVYLAGERHVVRVPRLYVVVERIGRLFVAFARVDEAVVEAPLSPAYPDDGRTAVPRDVGNLVAVMVGGGGR